jgi:hypothetical protein
VLLRGPEAAASSIRHHGMASLGPDLTLISLMDQGYKLYLHDLDWILCPGLYLSCITPVSSPLGLVLPCVWQGQARYRSL